ncbi:flavodoxin [Leptotrichia sp. OH3620_COT-345]|uniref:flavodoxin n=1 Tax=Leptotrichia sp. OH3620_COT-345 TaxID=2491048 RepID=UPI000F64DF33|nr:flavodoxin [Leptotrichia sp. OH3620_COT-345]RRD39463.1 flavodoxin [Leptotrichia sp. OH3620_COT-345]
MAELIAFYSRRGENYFDGIIKNVEKGNTEIVVEKLRELTGADVFQIKQLVEYSDNYNKCAEEVNEDFKNNARPELDEYPQELEKYDTIYLAYPNYCNTMPMVVFTFLEEFDFSGKTIKPICTNGGGGVGNSISDIKKLCPNSEVYKGLSVNNSEVPEAKQLIKDWLEKSKI